MDKNLEDSDEIQDLIEEIVCIYKKIKQKTEYKTYTFKTMRNYSKDNLKISSYVDFNKHSLNGSKYLYFDEEGIIQSDSFVSHHNDKFFWLNIVDPSSSDFEYLSKVKDVHETTIADIRDKNSREKIDVYRNYAFLSLKLLVSKKTREDINFNILIFDNFIITTHNKEWQGVNNILNFCYVISKATELEPTWVVFSIITEFVQDILFHCDEVERQQNTFISKHALKDFHSNFAYLHFVVVLKKYIKPKIKIVKKLLRTDFPSSSVRSFLKDTLKDFKELQQMLSGSKRAFERNQDMILALRDIELAEQSHKMNTMMNRMSKITFFFLPIQCVAGLWGMNVRVPFQYGTEGNESTFWFWLLTISGPILCILYVFFTEGSFFSSRMTRQKHKKEIQFDGV